GIRDCRAAPDLRPGAVCSEHAHPVRRRRGCNRTRSVDGTALDRLRRYRRRRALITRAVEGRTREDSSQSSLSPFGVPKTAMQPFRQLGNTLLAGSGRKTWLLWGFAASECELPCGVGAVAGVLNVGTTCTSVWRLASMTPSAGPLGLSREAV